MAKPTNSDVNIKCAVCKNLFESRSHETPGNVDAHYGLAFVCTSCLLDAKFFDMSSAPRDGTLLRLVKRCGKSVIARWGEYQNEWMTDIRRADTAINDDFIAWLPMCEVRNPEKS